MKFTVLAIAFLFGVGMSVVTAARADANMDRAIAEFKEIAPCPESGNYVKDVHGVCRGYVVAPIRPIECGGATARYNLRWMRTEDAAQQSIRASMGNCK